MHRAQHTQEEGKLPKLPLAHVLDPRLRIKIQVNNNIKSVTASFPPLAWVLKAAIWHSNSPLRLKSPLIKFSPTSRGPGASVTFGALQGA
ncbi:hypothetical protein Pcinc_012582 [Petrolisthes cinctipes]|uniref:Uncharacterized protein n=1 Tax=Petrolisthes cinctipes TaxID=88211 RepID=A0AAE1G0B0_PETCI|nr:hypothetical protein Pcinc_012582 [Petrolisthes cinctipes]